MRPHPARLLRQPARQAPARDEKPIIKRGHQEEPRVPRKRSESAARRKSEAYPQTPTGRAYGGNSPQKGSHRKEGAAPGVSAHRQLPGIAPKSLSHGSKTSKAPKTNDMATIFSRIIAGEIPSYKVAENDRYYAFLDINPLTEGHTLVVPKQETDYIFDLDDDTLSGMILFAKEVAARIRREIACKRVAMVVLGMEVPHAHIHLIPINSENDVDFHREKLRLSPEEFREIAQKLSR